MLTVFVQVSVGVGVGVGSIEWALLVQLLVCLLWVQFGDKRKDILMMQF